MARSTVLVIISPISSSSELVGGGSLVVFYMGVSDQKSGPNMQPNMIDVGKKSISNMKAKVAPEADKMEH